MTGVASDEARAGHEPSQHAVSAVPVTIANADEEWRGTKRQKEALRAKFGGRCAYCGNLLDKMHADHLQPVVRVNRDCMGKPLPAAECRMMKPERNVVSNMMPACGACNLHKGGYTLEQWRVYLQRSAEIVRKQTSTFRAGERFGVITVSAAPIVFYFERCSVLPSGCEYCADDDGGRMLPMYGVAPHECYWRKGPEFTIGQSTLIPFDQWDSAFVPELEPGETWANFVYPSACGTFYCPNCDAEKYAAAWDELVARIGPPPAQAIEARQGGNGVAGAVHESAVSEGNASNINHLPHDKKDSKKGVSRG